MQGQIVLVKSFDGRPFKCRIVRKIGECIYLSAESNYRRVLDGELYAVRFYEKDIFEYPKSGIPAKVSETWWNNQRKWKAE